MFIKRDLKSGKLTEEMTLNDSNVYRTIACSIAADSMSAIKYAKITPIRGEDGLATEFNIEGEYVQFGNNDLRVDDIAYYLVERFIKKTQKLTTYRGAVPT
nr:pyruvate formate lyase family protein [Sodalis-like endosymbiont of Proechinophthirus fluctus]